MFDFGIRFVWQFRVLRERAVAAEGEIGHGQFGEVSELDGVGRAEAPDEGVEMAVERGLVVGGADTFIGEEFVGVGVREGTEPGRRSGSQAGFDTECGHGCLRRRL